MKEYSVIGKSFPRKDAYLQATGQAEFVGDMVLPGMLFGKTLKSPYPHAKIINIDTSKALALPGVKSVITGKDTLGVKYGPIRSTQDRDILAIDKVRFIGDEVAAVAAIDEDTAEEALDLIEVQYEPLPAVFDPAEAIREGAPLIHEANERNIAVERLWDFGDVDAGFLEADHIRQDRFSSQLVIHGYLEPHACLAKYDSSGKLTVWANTQRPFAYRRDLSRLLGLPQHKIRVIKPYVGGGFGGKNFMVGSCYCASLLAMKTGRPVKIVYSLREDMACTHRRKSMILDIKTGVKKDGTLIAQYTKAMVDGGAFNIMGPVTLYNIGMSHIIPYRLPNFRLEAYQANTNKIPNCPMRGHAQLQPHFAIECQLDMIAEDLGLDPIEVRLKNALQTGDMTINGFHIISSGFSDALRQAAEVSGWKDKWNSKKANRGIGIGCSAYPCGARETAQSDTGAVITLAEDGGVTLLVGAVDLGQGANTVMAQIVAEVLGLTLDDVTVHAADTETTPHDPGAFASRTTFYAGNGVKRAAEDVRVQLAPVAAGKLGVSPEELQFKDRWITVKGHPEKRISFADIARRAQISGPDGKTIIGRGSYCPTNVVWPDTKTHAGNITGSYTFSVGVAELEVDAETGQVKINETTIAHDAGQVINPLLTDGQMEGSFGMGQGHALYEELKVEGGEVLNPGFRDYRIATVMDVPVMKTIHVFSDDPEGPFGAKEVGEGFICCVPPSIISAIHDATGVWIKDLPATPEKILAAIKQKRRGSR